MLETLRAYQTPEYSFIGLRKQK